MPTPQQTDPPPNLPRRRRPRTYCPSDIPRALTRLCTLLGIPAESLDACATCEMFEGLVKRRYHSVIPYLHPDTQHDSTPTTLKTFQLLVAETRWCLRHHQGWKFILAVRHRNIVVGTLDQLPWDLDRDAYRQANPMPCSWYGYTGA